MVYPTNAPSTGSLHVQENNLGSILLASTTAVQTTLTLSDSSSFPGAGFVTAESEAIEYTANATGTGILSGLTRGADSTTAAIHDAGIEIRANIVAAHHNRMADEMIGVGGDLFNAINADLDDTVGATATATSIENRLDMVAGQVSKIISGTTGSWKAAPAANLSQSLGKVLQFVVGTSTTVFSTTNTSMTTANLSAPITPTNSTTTILVFANGLVRNSAASIDNVRTTLLKGATDIGNINGLAAVAGPTGVLDGSGFMFAPDVPATTGSVTYSVGIRTDNASSTASYGFTGKQMMLLMEVS